MNEVHKLAFLKIGKPLTLGDGKRTHNILDRFDDAQGRRFRAVSRSLRNKGNTSLSLCNGY